jgi:PAS domain S-box-containing protein
MSSIYTRLPWRTPNRSSPFHLIVIPSVLVFVCFLATKLGWALMIRPEMLWPIWPGCAILLAALLLAPRRIWPILIAAGLAGFVLYDLKVGLPLRPTLLLILTDLAEVLIAAVGISYSFEGVPRLNSIKALVRYSVFAVLLAPLAAASIATAAFDGNYWVRWRIGFFTEALGLLTLTPAILSWVSAGPKFVRKSRASHFEAATLIVGLSLLCYVAFVAPGRIAPPLAIYSLLPFLLWAALRFGLVGISTSMMVVAFLSVWGAVHGRGPFTGSDPLKNVMSLQLFLFFAAATFMVLAVLVEEQKETDHAFRESEKRFRLVADTAPVLIWMADTDKLCTYFNKPWLDFTGRSINQELGNGWAEGVHAEDLRKCMDTYTQAFARRVEFRMEYRLRRYDGEYRWIIDIGVPRFDEQRSFVGYIGTCIDVTDSRRAEQALEKSEEKFAKAFRQSPVILTLTSTKDHRYIDVNETFERVTGWRRDEVIGRTPFDIGFWVQPSKRLELTNQLLSEGRLRNVETSFRMKDGSIRIGSSTAELIELNGEPCMLGVGADITEQKHAEEALRKSEERFRLAAQAGKMYAYEWDVATDRVMRSEEYVNVLGSSDEAKQLTRQQLVTRVHPDDREKFVAAVADLTPDNSSVRISYRMLHPDGAVIWVEKNARAFFDGQGRMSRVIGMVTDITERRRAEEALRESEARLRLAAQAGKMYAYEWDGETDVTVRSEEYAKILGLTGVQSSETHHQFTSRIHPEDLTAFSSSIASLTPEHATIQTSYRMIRADGAVIWLEKSGRAFFDAQGRMSRMIGIVADITERKRAEEALRDSEERFRLAAQAGKMFAYEWDAATDVIVRSAESAQILGIDEKARVTGQQILATVHPDDRGELMAAVAALSVNKPNLQVRYRMVRPDGSVIWLERNSRAHFDEQGKMQKIVGMVVDVTERKRAEDALAGMSLRLIDAQEKERARIARELHDDMGQRLALLANELEQLQQSFPDLQVEVIRVLRELQKSTFQIATDVQSLSHDLHSSKLEYLGIAAAMRGFCHEFGGQHKVDLDFKSHDVPSYLSPDISLTLFRVLQEAIQNAVKHSGIRRVEVELRGTPDEIRLTVSDSGTGFDIKAVQESRGLGLVSMEERLKLVKGTLSIESHPNRGTTIHARVPLSPGNDSLRAAG